MLLRYYMRVVRQMPIVVHANIFIQIGIYVVSI